MVPPIAAVSVRYPVKPLLDAWVLPEGTVPQSIPHDDAAKHLQLVLEAWVKRTGRQARVPRELAIRWLEDHPGVGIDPDVCLLEPLPPGVDRLGSLRLWTPGHHPPPVCFEVVSTQHPYKDYATLQDRYAAMGTRELVIFDPLLAGPKSLGGPVLLQRWRREGPLFERVHFGDEPTYSEVLDAWLVPDGGLLEIADDRAGTRRWPTGEEHEREERQRAEMERQRAEMERQRAETERQRAEMERQRAEDDARRAEADRERAEAARVDLERRVRELEARLGTKGG